MTALFSLILRLLLVAAGLVATAAVAAIAALAGAVWLLRSGWLRLTGARTLKPRMPARQTGGTGAVRGTGPSRMPRGSASDITDVVPREPTRHA
jgi:hypothetical protein